ncbi:helix-turn-helix transcriptional regulator [Piscinibacter terrae]|uniref:AlpA family phage regulatory protein n=1 Tax=Piscinibacter terrae TaxID=2496871 RepID=A0A3N7HMD5_9BURK|nr:AlpA family phage regulatory protein [Albitalea terrae]RQP23337.1 AlpA family phage regulatory protein [Albitalea terrae]
MNDVDSAALRRFDELPASANVRLPVVATLFSISRATVWRWCRKGHLPQPTHIQGVTFWNVGALRLCLLSQTKVTLPVAGMAQPAPPADDSSQEASEVRNGIHGTQGQ